MDQEITCQSSVTLSQINLISGLFTAGILSLLRLLSGSYRPSRRTWRICNWILENMTLVNEHRGRWVVCGFKLMADNSRSFMIGPYLSNFGFLLLDQLGHPEQHKINFLRDQIKSCAGFKPLRPTHPQIIPNQDWNVSDLLLCLASPRTCTMAGAASPALL